MGYPDCWVKKCKNAGYLTVTINQTQRIVCSKHAKLYDSNKPGEK